MIRRDQGGGPICATTAAIRVWRTLAHVVLAAWGGVGPVASSLMTIVAGDGSGEGISEDIAPSARRVKAGRPAREGRRRSRRAASAWRMRPVTVPSRRRPRLARGFRGRYRGRKRRPRAPPFGTGLASSRRQGRLLLGSGGGPPRN